MRPLVHDPMKTVSTGMSRTAVPALQAHVGQRPRGGLPGRTRLANWSGAGTAPPIGTTWAGLVPQVT